MLISFLVTVFLKNSFVFFSKYNLLWSPCSKCAPFIFKHHFGFFFSLILWTFIVFGFSYSSSIGYSYFLALTTPLTRILNKKDHYMLPVTVNHL